jgi:hypothetical protein
MNWLDMQEMGLSPRHMAYTAEPEIGKNITSLNTRQQQRGRASDAQVNVEHLGLVVLLNQSLANTNDEARVPLSALATKNNRKIRRQRRCLVGCGAARPYVSRRVESVGGEEGWALLAPKREREREIQRGGKIGVGSLIEREKERARVGENSD